MVESTRMDRSSATAGDSAVSRRRFLQLAAGVGGGLLLGGQVVTGGRLAHADTLDAGAGSAGDGQLNLWLHIDQNNQFTVTIAASEMGQGVYTSLAMLVAEELEVEWQSVKATMAPVASTFSNPLFGMQATGGSTTIRWAFEPLRQIGANARVLLVQAAAQQWGVDAAECVASKGTVTHQASGKVLRYSDVADAASKLPMPESVPLKSPDQWSLLGTPAKRLDTPMKVNGSAGFGIDVQLPDLLVATIAACPTFGGSLESVDEAPALAVNGVEHVVKLDNAVAVVASGYWPAKKGLAALKPVWSKGGNAGRNTDSYRGELESALKEPMSLAHKVGDVDSVFSQSSQIIEAVYEVPHMAHATMEPMNATAWVRKDGVEIWAPTQAPGVIQQALAGVLGVEAETISVHTTFLGGGFGRRFEVDFVIQAALISAQTGQAVKLVWSREEDTRHDYYRPAAMSQFRATLDEDGYPSAWHNRIASPSILSRVFPNFLKDGIDAQSVEGAADLAIAVPNQLVEARIVETGLPVGFWRSVGHSYNAFFVESFIDELANAAGIDPYDYQMKLLSNRKRHQGVLSAAAAMAQWPKRSSERPMGLAVHESFGSYCALVVQLAPDVDKGLRIERISAAIDCGQALNPDTVKAQVESSIVYGMSAAYYGDVTVEDGAVVQGNFTDYKVLKLAQMPEVNLEIVNSGEAMGGIGEPGLPPLAPALANAIFYTTGKRVRRLPLEKAGFKIA